MQLESKFAPLQRSEGVRAGNVLLDLNLSSQMDFYCNGSGTKVVQYLVHVTREREQAHMCFEENEHIIGIDFERL